MDKSILRKFAIESRQELMSKIKNKIQTFYIDEDFSKEQKGELYVLSNEKHSLSLTKEEYQKRELLIKRINELSLEQVIEEAAYTWFNRIIAIRYMEINDMLPLTKDNQSLGIRVLSSKDNTPDPEILKFSNLTNPDLDIEFKKEKYVELKTDNEKFKYILLLVCKKLGKVIPQVFDGVTDYIDILIPDNLLNDTGFITKVIKEVAEDNYNQVEIIGWLYQYYNQTEKDRVISAKKINKKSEIAYATQLFTPDWIVKYMVENSLGKYWVEHSENGDLIKTNWRYFIDTNINKNKNKINPNEIAFIDPCCGSGHILVYAFDIFYQIYQSLGYNKKDIPEQILKYNLYGLDIDDRAGQLTILSILLKARENDKNIFNKEIVRNLNVMSIQESNSINEFVISNLTDKDSQNNALYLIDVFTNAKEVGSLVQLEKKDYTDLKERIMEDDTIFGLELKEKILPLIKQAEILTNAYDLVVTNPPYMNKGAMPENLKKFVFKNYANYKTDLFSAFVIRNIKFSKKDGLLGFMTPYVWMFISSYEEFRQDLLSLVGIDSLIQLEYSSFEEAVVPICSFVIRNTEENIQGNYIKLSDYRGGMKVQEEKFIEIKNKKHKDFFTTDSKNISKIPGMPISYWLSEEMYATFLNKKISDYTLPKAGVVTGNDSFFVKYWTEVNFNDIVFEQNNNGEYGKYHIFQKGGDFRRWYGNYNYIIALNNLYNPIFDNPSIRKGDREFYFKSGIGWSQIGSNNEKSFRLIKNAVCGTATPTLYLKDKKYENYLLALLNTKYSEIIINILNPTLNLHANEVAKIPFIIDENRLAEIDLLVNENLEICKEDWDSYEISWDFNEHPLIEYKTGAGYESNCDNWNYYIKDAYNSWESNCEEKFKLLKYNEEKINNIFIEIYGLQKELNAQIKDKDVSVRKADKLREIKSLISYAVGCMFGRYSLTEKGIVYAGGDFDINKYKSFKADVDNIIPITDEAYFADDIVGKFKKFIEVVYGADTLNDNLDFIAETLGKKGTETSEDTIRRYFNNDFYSDHIKIYQKKPIYWLFDSGKKNGFKCLVYMHRYNEGLVPKVRLDYLHRIQTTYEKLLSDISYKLTTELSMSDKKEAQKKQAELSGKLQETIEYDEKIAHIANQKINIDLDDGVSINYDKFKDILAKLK